MKILNSVTVSMRLKNQINQLHISMPFQIPRRPRGWHRHTRLHDVGPRLSSWFNSIHCVDVIFKLHFLPFLFQTHKKFELQVFHLYLPTEVICMCSDENFVKHENRSTPSNRTIENVVHRTSVKQLIWQYFGCILGVSMQFNCPCVSETDAELVRYHNNRCNRHFWLPQNFTPPPR